MKYTDTDDLSLSTIFFITGISFFLFNLILKIIEGRNSPLLIWTAVIASSLGAIILIGKTLFEAPHHSKKKPSH
jgi:hypothetical protein